MEINFVYSRAYDEMLNRISKGKLSENNIREMVLFKEELESSWNVDGSGLIKEIEHVSGLRFKGSKSCYLVSKMFYAAISHPLTLRKEKNLDEIKQRLIHELVHIILADNFDKVGKFITNSYSDEDFMFKNHVPVLLITRKVIENIYGKESFQKLLDKDMKIELRYVWPEVNRIYDKFNSNIVKFLKNEDLS